MRTRQAIYWTVFGALTVMAAFPGEIRAEETVRTEGQLQAVTVETGRPVLVFQVRGGGISPVFHTLPAKTGRTLYVSAGGVGFADDLGFDAELLKSRLGEWYPDIGPIRLYREEENGRLSVTLAITAKKTLEPVVLSNSGNLLAISLAGENPPSRPPDREIIAAVPSTAKADISVQRQSVALASYLDDPAIDGSVRQAIRRLMTGDTAGALLSLNTYTDKKPDDVVARYALARTHWVLGDEDTAIRKLTELLEAAPGFRPARLMLVQGHLNRGDLGTAELLVSEGLRRHPDSSALRFYEAELYERTGQTDEARQRYVALLGDEPHNPVYYEKLAWLALRRHQPEAALSCIKAGLLAAPGNTHLHALAGDAYAESNQPDKALAHYAASMDYENLLAYARFLAQQEKPELALKVLALMPGAEETDPDRLYRLGMLYLDLDRKGHAREVLTRFVEISPDPRAIRVLEAKRALKTLEREAPAPADGAALQG